MSTESGTSLLETLIGMSLALVLSISLGHSLIVYSKLSKPSAKNEESTTLNTKLNCIEITVGTFLLSRCTPTDYLILDVK